MRKPFDGDYSITQNFDDPRFRSSYLKFGILGHNGIDYGLPTGTLLVAPHSGKVLEAQNDPTGYGNYVKLENDVEGSVLGHMQSFSVRIGDQVAEGQQIGISDNTGNSTGPHLHWGYYRLPRNRDNGFNGYIDQTDWLNLKLPVLTITDQTRIPQIDNMEVQAIKSTLLDKTAEITGLKLSINSLNGKISSMQAQQDATNEALASCNQLRQAQITETVRTTSTTPTVIVTSTLPPQPSPTFIAWLKKLLGLG